MRTVSRVTRTAAALTTVVLGAVSLTACNSLVGNPDLPAGTESPSTYDTPAGALAQASAAQSIFQSELVNYVTATGVLTDEMTIAPNNGQTTPTENGWDVRDLPDGSSIADNDYRQLQRVRGQARQARGMVAKYAPATSPAVLAQLYAYEAYTDILLADMFCSGVPLSTLDFEKDFTYKPGSPTADIYRDAIALLDTAQTLAADSQNVQVLIQVSRGRALLSMGQYDDAAAAVASVPSGAAYHIKVSFGTNGGSFRAAGALASMADMEGTNGQPYVFGNDPRTASKSVWVYVYGYVPTILPNKYNTYPLRGDTVVLNATPDSVSFVMADWIEARLIQAEAALHDGDVQGWADILNALRATAGATLTPALGAMPALPADSTTSASATIRVDVMFRERAFWLYLTGHRNGDLRRLVRQYGRSAEMVYPTGVYLSGVSPTGTYHTDVNAPVPPGELTNPLFHGCINRDA